MLFILGIILFILLIVLHEFGHMVAAKRNGVEVEEFGIGFPPRAVGKQLRKSKGDKTLYSLNWLPLGGFVKLKGEHDNAKEKGSFGVAPLNVKVKILLAGVGMNFLTAWVLLTILFLVGAPKLPFKSLPFYEKDQWIVQSDTKEINTGTFVESVKASSPAESIGLKAGDEILSVGGESLNSGKSLHDITASLAGKEVELSYKSVDSKKTEIKKVKLREPNTADGILGVGVSSEVKLKSTWSAPVNAFYVMIQSGDATFRALGYAFNKVVGGEAQEAGNVVGGPFATVNAIRLVSAGGLVQLTLLIALISLSLGIMNILPIPALDGGRLFLILLFRLRRKELTKEKEEKINAWGMGFLLIFIALITVLDISKIW
jgi:regulator of sigma E protease